MILRELNCSEKKHGFIINFHVVYIWKVPFAIQSEMNPIFRPFCNFMSLVRAVFLSFSRIFFKYIQTCATNSCKHKLNCVWVSVFCVDQFIFGIRCMFYLCMCECVVFNFMLLPSDFHISYGKNDIQQWHVLGECVFVCERAAIIPRHHYHYHHHLHQQ